MSGGVKVRLSNLRTLYQAKSVVTASCSGAVLLLVVLVIVQSGWNNEGGEPPNFTITRKISN